MQRSAAARAAASSSPASTWARHQASPLRRMNARPSSLATHAAASVTVHAGAGREVQGEAEQHRVPADADGARTELLPALRVDVGDVLDVQG